MDKLRDVFDLVRATLEKWQKDRVSRLAAALAFFSVLSIPPILVLIVAISGQVIGEQNAQQFILEQTAQVVGPAGQQAIRTILEEASQPEGASLATITSIAILFFGASGVFVQLQDAMNTVWNVKLDPEDGLMNSIRNRASSLLIIIALGLLLAVILLVNSLVALLGRSLNDILPETFAWVRILNDGFTFVTVTLLIALLFKFIPDVQIAWRDLWVGALATAILFMIGLYAMGVYFRFSDPTSSYGAAGSLMALLIWIYYSAQILFIGAEFTQTYASRYGEDIVPDDDALWQEPPQEGQ